MRFLLFFLFVGAMRYERGLEVHSSCDSLETNIQVSIKLDTRCLIKDGKLDTKGQGLRFVKRSKTIPFWIADSIHTCTTNIWLKLDTLSPEENKLTIFYTDSTDICEYSFDSVFTKTTFDSADSWVFHCDEGTGGVSAATAGEDSILLEDVSWASDDGGSWGNRKDQTFASGSALVFKAGSFAQWDMSADILKDSFTFALWFRLDTMQHLTYSASERVLAFHPSYFKLFLRQGSLGFNLSAVEKPRTCYFPPFGWERVGSPVIPQGFIPQGLTCMGEYLVFSAYRKNDPLSRVWRVDPLDLTLLDWFDMPLEATHTSGLAYDSLRNILWASDYDSRYIYAIDPAKSFDTHRACVIGEFDMIWEGVSACCMASFKDTQRLVVSTFKETGRTCVLDETKSLEKGMPTLLGSYNNTHSSQGLAYDGQFLWESSNSNLVQLDLEKAVEGGKYSSGLVSCWSEPYLAEDLAFLRDTLWTSSEDWNKAFYKLTADQKDYLDRWMHFMATYDGQVLRIYQNAELVDSASVGCPKESFFSSSLFLGGKLNGESSFEGSLDEIVVLPRAMDNNEIQALFERRKPLFAEPSFTVEKKEDTLPDIGSLVERTCDPLKITRVSSKLTFTIPYRQKVSVDMFDVCGRRIAILFPLQEVDGIVDVYWPHFVTNGVYYVVFRSGSEMFSQKVVIAR